MLICNLLSNSLFSSIGLACQRDKLGMAKVAHEKIDISNPIKFGHVNDMPSRDAIKLKL